MWSALSLLATPIQLHKVVAPSAQKSDENDEYFDAEDKTNGLLKLLNLRYAHWSRRSLEFIRRRIWELARKAYVFIPLCF